MEKERKEHHRRNLPHFQQPGQEYFITTNLKNAIPPKALARYTVSLERIKNDIEKLKTDKSKEKELMLLKKEYYIERNKYMKAFDDMLALDSSSEINLNLPEIRKIMFEAFHYYEGRRIENHAFCVMRNHFHWVMRVFEKDENGKPVYLQDIMKVVKGVSANKINKLDNKTGRIVWQDESFDVTLRNDRHWYNAMLYTINNPVKAGLVKHWWEWEGTWCKYDI
ncbi:MAG: transposase [Petrimonas sp.]|nr:MAG: Transposase IS200 like protein [Bacteroidetes bacterium ADurb.BinA174]